MNAVEAFSFISTVTSSNHSPDLSYFRGVNCIAESGSTKTIWVFLEGDQEYIRVESIGLNPFFVDVAEVEQVATEVGAKAGVEELDTVHFYGSGCSSPDRNRRIADGLNLAWQAKSVNVYHDLLAAARAACQTQSGIVGILGTGSNSCVYDGSDITDNIPAMGFILGDEGRGTSSGRRLLQAWAYREMESHISAAFELKFELTKEKALHALYYESKPNRFLASLAAFCADHRKEPLIQGILHDSFTEFVRRHIMKYQGSSRLPIHFIGSIAFYYRATLEAVLQENGLKLGAIIQSPINALVKFHVTNEVG
jgi:N-acetylglucosamine kinase-like BadF-type ATPase